MMISHASPWTRRWSWLPLPARSRTDPEGSARSACQWTTIDPLAGWGTRKANLITRFETVTHVKAYYDFFLFLVSLLKFCFPGAVASSFEIWESTGSGGKTEWKFLLVPCTINPEKKHEYASCLKSCWQPYYGHIIDACKSCQISSLDIGLKYFKSGGLVDLINPSGRKGIRTNVPLLAFNYQCFKGYLPVSNVCAILKICELY